MEDYEYRVINSHAIQSQNTSKFTCKTQLEPLIGVYIGGAMGGLTPLQSLLPGCIPPPREGCLVPGLFPREPSLWVPMETIPRGANPQRGNPSGGFPEQSLPQMAPLILGLLGFAREYSWSLCYRFSPIYTDFLGRLFLVSSRVFIPH